MDASQVFKAGRSQAVKLPKEYRFTESEVTAQNFGGRPLLLSKNSLFTTISASLVSFEPGLQLTRE